MGNGNAAIEGMYNGAAFAFNAEELEKIEDKATTCLSSQYKDCDQFYNIKKATLYMY